VIDPMDVINKYGADSLRFTLSMLAAQGRDIKLSEDRIDGYRKFMNKIWNAYRFIELNTKGIDISVKPEKLSPASIWIKLRLAKTIQKVEESLKKYKYNDAAEAVYQFIWHEFCDYYIEMSKVHMNDDYSYAVRYTLLEIFESTMRLLHPFAPFITEELWQKLPNKTDESIMVATYPTPVIPEFGEKVEESIDMVIDIIKAIRNLRGENSIQPAKKIKIYLNIKNERSESTIMEFRNYIYALANVSSLSIKSQPDEQCLAHSTIYGDIYLPVEGNIDIEKEIKRLAKLLKKQEKSLIFLNSQLSNQSFLDRAPEELIKEKRIELDEVSEIYSKTKQRIKVLKG